MKGYRMAEIYPGGPRVKVTVRDGVDGFVSRRSDACPGCAEVPESTPSLERGRGCHVCGFTGRRRWEVWTPFDPDEWAAKQTSRGLDPTEPPPARPVNKRAVEDRDHQRFGRIEGVIAQESLVAESLAPVLAEVRAILEETPEAQEQRAARPAAEDR